MAVEKLISAKNRESEIASGCDTHAARIHSDHPEYVWRRDDGLDAGSAWTSREAGDAALMDVSGRQSAA